MRFSSPDVTAADFRWPICTIDFEASALGEGSYPIEVGLAIWNDPHGPIEVWSTLIQPTDNWLTNGHWNDQSAAIHNIPLSDLANGMTPARAISEIIRRVGIGGTAFCDGGDHDLHWMRTLARAAGSNAPIFLVSVETLYSRLSEKQIQAVVNFIRDNPVPHRAGPDATLHLCALATALGMPVPAISSIKSIAA